MNNKEIFIKAQKEHYAIGAFNFSTLEQLRGICEAASVLKSPIIIETSPGEADFLGIDLVPEIIKVFRKRYGLEAILNLDHGKDLDKIKQAIDYGYDMVQFDGSELDYQENLTKTIDIVKYAHGHNVLVEGELGHLKGTSTLQDESPLMSVEDFTDPNLAQDFVEKTQVDFLAIAVGNVHGVITSANGNPRLDIERIKKIRQMTDIFLSLHGGSGTNEDDLKAAIEAGIIKININTDLRSAYTQSLRQKLIENKDEVVPYKYLTQPIEKVREIVEYKIKLFGSVNKF